MSELYNDAQNDDNDPNWSPGQEQNSDSDFEEESRENVCTYTTVFSFMKMYDKY